VWLLRYLQNPLPYLQQQAHHRFDIQAENDGNMLGAGFLYLKPSAATRSVWSELVAQHRSLIQLAENTDSIGFDDNEQVGCIMRHVHFRAKYSASVLIGVYMLNSDFAAQAYRRESSDRPTGSSTRGYWRGKPKLSR